MAIVERLSLSSITPPFSRYPMKTYVNLPWDFDLHFEIQISVFLQEKDDDTQEGIDRDKPLLEQTLRMMESTSSRDNRDIILDITLSSENLAAVSN